MARTRTASELSRTGTLTERQKEAFIINRSNLVLSVADDISEDVPNAAIQEVRATGDCPCRWTIEHVPSRHGRQGLTETVAGTTHLAKSK